MCPAIASGIVTEDALVSYWPMLLAIITICTRAQLHSKTISGFARVASVSVRFLPCAHSKADHACQIITQFLYH